MNLTKADRNEIVGNLGDYLRNVREQRGLTQQDLSTLSGIRQQHLSKIERQATIPRVDTLMRLAKALGVEVDHFSKHATSDKDQGIPYAAWHDFVEAPYLGVVPCTRDTYLQPWGKIHLLDPVIERPRVVKTGETIYGVQVKPGLPQPKDVFVMIEAGELVIVNDQNTIQEPGVYLIDDGEEIMLRYLELKIGTTMIYIGRHGEVMIRDRVSVQCLGKAVAIQPPSRRL